MFRAIVLCTVAAAASATEFVGLEAFEEGIAGKAAFVKFLAPW
jgi:hypothetical protein